MPGPLKPTYFLTKDGEKITALWSCHYMVVAGNAGVAVAAISFSTSFKVSVSADDGIFSAENTELFCQEIRNNINDEIERAKDFPIPDPKKKE